MVADDAQHVLAVRLIAGEGAELARHFGGRRIGHAGHDRGERAADRARFVGVVGDAGRHQQAADIGVAQAERAVAVESTAISFDGNCAIITEISSTMVQSRTACSYDVDVELLGRVVTELQQVQRREIARRVVEEHVFRARVRRADRAGRRAGVPVVDGRVELNAGIGACPGGVTDLVPEVLRLDGFGDLAVLAPVRFQSPSVSTAVRKSSVTRTELFEFWPETVR